MKDKTRNWLENAGESAYNALDYANKLNPTFAETIKGIKNPLSEEDIAAYYKEDPYKGVVATSLWLNKHILTPREFVLLASSKAVVIRCQIRYWTRLLNEEGVRPAFYASAGHLYESRKPLGVETSAIFTLPPWELLHFIDIDTFSSNRLPILDINRHYTILKNVHSEKIEDWYTLNDDGGIVANKDLMDSIYFDYCVRMSSNRRVIPELDVVRKRSYFFLYPIDFHVVANNIGFHYEKETSSDTKQMFSWVIDTLYTNGLLMIKPNIADYIRLDAFIMSNPNIDTSDINLEGGGKVSILRKGTSPEDPISLSCPHFLVKDVEERIILYLTESIVYIPRYEDWETVGIESRTINGKVFDVGTVRIRYLDIFGRMTSQHLIEWFFINTYMA